MRGPSVAAGPLEFQSAGICVALISAEISRKSEFNTSGIQRRSTYMNRVLSQHRKGFKLRAGPSGLHLFDRKTGWNVLVDEMRIPPTQWARAPRQTSIALTNACDLDCPYCYAPKTFGLLDADQVAAWLRELDDNGCFGVGFGGGEPTLHCNFIEICRQAAEQTNLAVTFTTHAHRITHRYVDQLKGERSLHSGEYGRNWRDVRIVAGKAVCGSAITH